MKSTADTGPAGRYSLVLDSRFCRKSPINRGPVSTETGIRCDQRLECAADFDGIELWQDKICGFPGPITHHQHWNLVGPRSAS